MNGPVNWFVKILLSQCQQHLVTLAGAGLFHTFHGLVPTSESAYQVRGVATSFYELPDMTNQQTSIQAGLDRYLDYFDIMLLGRTGSGKTTTSDKILIANPTNEDYSCIPPEKESVVVTIEEPDNDNPPPQGAVGGGEAVGGAGAAESRKDAARRSLSTCTQCHDLSIWHLSEGTEQLECMTQRLKKLVLARILGSPHDEIMNIRKESKSTEKCELLSNDTTRVRVLDVPGFYGPNASCSASREPRPSQSEAAGSSSESDSVTTSVRDRVRETAETDLSIMRKILHIKMAKKFKFNRIVYFLPETGVLTRSSQILQTELAIMENYFGTSIFECMTVAATHNHSAYSKFARGVELYTSDEIETTRAFFQEALRTVLNGEEVPEPPIIFISLWDTCEDVLSKIRESDVMREGVNLNFNPSTCARCGIKIGRLKEDEHKRVQQTGEGGGSNEATPDVAAVASFGSWSNAIPYEESTCHPMFIPKYTTIQRIVGGIVHLVTFNRFVGRWPWPDFGNLDEVCIKCKGSPKAAGCTQVKTVYVHERYKDGIYVDHKSTVDESFVIELDPDDEQGESEPQPSMLIGSGHHYFEAKNEGCLSIGIENEDMEKRED